MFITEIETNYDLEVLTSSEIGSGTDALVTLNMYGTNGEILNVKLIKSLTNKNPFERDQLDKFTFKDKFIGSVRFLNYLNLIIIFMNYKLLTVNQN